MAELSSGTMVDGRYKVLSRLGAGGMADVFLAEDQQLGRKVALKLLHRRFAEDPGFVERFRREAQAAAGLQHPNVVSVYDRGSYDGTYYIAMEYLPGRSLKQLIRQDAPLDPVRAIDITIQILKAARFAHRHGVIHRDLKPHNVIVDDADHAKVTDFGIARAGASDMTETGSIMGTAQYLSPEQAQGHAVSAGSDLYSIGVILYEMLTGRVPFDAEAAVTIALKHVSEAPTPPTAINRQIPPELEHVVMWALNKDPADRPRDADQFLTVLEQAKEAILSHTRGQRTMSMPALAGVGGAVGGLAGAAAASAAGEAGPPATMLQSGADGHGALIGEETEPPGPGQGRNRRRWWIAAGIVLLIAAIGVAAYFISRPTKKVVPSVVNLTLNDARTILQNDGFGVSVIDVTSAKPQGIVISQDPQALAKADEGSTVSLTVSSGPGNATVPPVKGLTLTLAKRRINAAKLKVGDIQRQSSATVPDGIVIDTDPAAGTSPPVGSQVTIIVSSGKPLATVPDVTGQTEAQARANLQNRGFQVTSSTQTSSTATPGTVISQNPLGNTQAAQGSTVSIVVAKAPPTVTVPDVVGKTASAASAQLTGMGLNVVQTTQSVTDPTKDGIVLSQNPGAGSSVNKGSTVTIVIGKFTTQTATTQTPTTSSSTNTNTTGSKTK